MKRSCCLTLLGLLVISSAYAFVDECGQYTSCRTCLNIPDGKTTGGRNNCGWCHFNIEYAAGGTGKRCADIRDQPWRCTDEYDTYKCGIGYTCDYTKGQCVMAPEGEGFGNKTTCEQHCFVTPDTYKCNTTTYQCVKCQPGEPNCQDQTSACANCKSPVPPPPTPSPDHFYCDEASMTCKNGTSGGTSKAACTQTCTNSTPASLVGLWRGLEAQKGFAVGEWDIKFETATATVKDKDGNVYHFTVSQTPGFIKLTCTDEACNGKVFKIVDVNDNNGVETESHAFLVSAPNGEAPTSMPDAMAGANGQRVFVVTRCNSWKGKCDFSSVFNKMKLRARESDTAAAVRMLQTSDKCNQFTTCATCIGASLGGSIKCGWCMGGTIVYNVTGDSGLHCAGFEQGKPFAFTCSPEFRTEDCRGYACNWTNPVAPQCTLEDGGSQTKENCEADCQAQQMTKCNYTSKKCEPCTGAGCVTSAQCEAVCNAPHSKCNYETKKCESCDPGTDKNCTMTSGQCDTVCSQQTFGICDPNSGKCTTCDPSKGQAGCVSGCNDTCSVHPSGGNYGCDWSNSSAPKCVAGKGSQSQQDCMTNCQAVSYALCNVMTGQCESCDPAKDPKCIYTQAYCNASCHKEVIPAGEYRAISINQQFKRGEFDFTFKDDGTVTFKFGTFQYAATVSNAPAPPAEGMSIRFTLTSVPSASGAPFPASVGQTMDGLYTTSPGQQGVTKYFYLGLGLPSSDMATSFDDGMVKLEFVLTACKQDGQNNCDFSSVKL